MQFTYFILTQSVIQSLFNYSSIPNFNISKIDEFEDILNKYIPRNVLIY